jgi:hypothetical protein
MEKPNLHLADMQKRKIRTKCIKEVIAGISCNHKELTLVIQMRTLLHTPNA